MFSNYCSRKGNSMAAIYLVAVMEFLAAMILELAGNAAKDDKKSCIRRHHLQLAIR